MEDRTCYYAGQCAIELAVMSANRFARSCYESRSELPRDFGWTGFEDVGCAKQDVPGNPSPLERDFVWRHAQEVEQPGRNPLCYIVRNYVRSAAVHFLPRVIIIPVPASSQGELENFIQCFL